MTKFKILSITLIFASCLISVNGKRAPVFQHISRYYNRRCCDNNNSNNNATLTNPVVRFSDGAVRGFTMRTATGRAIDGFQSIPFAHPPIGQLRFADPVKNVPWIGMRDAIAQSPQCLQLDLLKNFAIHGQENCLYLNIYRPQGRLSGSQRLPVIVWIHGGAFFWGSGSIYGPAYMLDRDIILVTFNYRLGPFGFLSTGDDASPGNQGLKDQTMVLKWVQENIAAFGGDKNAVTIQGESSGSISVHHHMVSPLSRGLFIRAMSNSISGMCQTSILEDSIVTAKRVGNLLNCTGTSFEMIDCLRKLDAGQIVPVQLGLFEWNIFPTVVFGPAIEHRHPGAFLIETPENAYKNNRVAKVPWIHGFNKDEMGWLASGVMLDPTAIADINNDWDRVGPILLGLVLNTTEINVEVAWKIRRQYMGNSNLTFETRRKFADMLGDRFVMECGLESIRYHSRYTKAPVYAYQFIYEGRYSIVQLYGENPKDWGVVHLDDLIYMFNNTEYWQTLQPEDEEFQMSRIMTSMWSNFAIYGRPFLQTGRRLLDVWQPIPPSTSNNSPIRMLELDLTPKMINDPYVERYNFWRKLNLVD